MSMAHLEDPGQDVQAKGPRPCMRHLLVEGCGREPHRDTQKCAPGGSRDRLQGSVVQRVQDEHQQAPVDHRRTASNCQGHLETQRQVQKHRQDRKLQLVAPTPELKT